jgi:hypothetical protein
VQIADRDGRLSHPSGTVVAMPRRTATWLLVALVGALVSSVAFVGSPADGAAPSPLPAADATASEPAKGGGEELPADPGTDEGAGTSGAVGRIVGGTQVSTAYGNVVTRIITSSSSLCSGTLIAARWVLTAAHCVEPRAQIFAGATTLSGLRPLGGATGIPHPLYTANGWSIRYDVGLYQLDAPHPLTGQEVRLATTDDPWSYTPGQATVTMGWGLTSSGGSVSNVLLQGTMQVLADSVCATLDLGINTVYDPTTGMCTFATGVSACNGDSGGPTFATRNGVTVQVGVTSYGPAGCGGHSVSAWVPSALPWIRSLTGVTGAVPGDRSVVPTDPLLAGVSPVRVSGPDRYGTAAAAAASWTSSDAVFLATGLNFPDSLAAGAAAARLQAPLLLVRTDSIPADTLRALQQLRPSTIYVAGGPSAVSETVLDSLRSVIGAEVVRLGGVDRYATAAQLAELSWPDTGVGGRVWVASGRAFVDPLIASAAAAVYDEPFVLVDAGRPLTADVRAAITRLAPGSIAFVGSRETTSSEFLAELGTLTGSVRHFGHPAVSARSASVWAELSSATWASLATFADFPDALAAVAWSGLDPVSPLFLVSPSCLNGSIADGLARLSVRNLALFGGPAALAPAVEARVRC